MSDVANVDQVIATLKGIFPEKIQIFGVSFKRKISPGELIIIDYSMPNVRTEDNDATFMFFPITVNVFVHRNFIKFSWANGLRLYNAKFRLKVKSRSFNSIEEAESMLKIDEEVIRDIECGFIEFMSRCPDDKTMKMLKNNDAFQNAMTIYDIIK